jgi:hypothetical protein
MPYVHNEVISDQIWLNPVGKGRPGESRFS